MEPWKKNTSPRSNSQRRKWCWKWNYNRQVKNRQEFQIIQLLEYLSLSLSLDSVTVKSFQLSTTFYMHTQRLHAHRDINFESCSIKPNMEYKYIFPESYLFETVRSPVLLQSDWKNVTIIQILFDLTRFKIDLSVWYTWHICFIFHVKRDL